MQQIVMAINPAEPYGGDCPDCSALAGQPCDANCLRYREDPDE
jgi:hypothetical protein